ncbi:hypothetical protein ACQ7B2_09790, partial [Escherichia coli]
GQSSCPAAASGSWENIANVQQVLSKRLGRWRNARCLGHILAGDKPPRYSRVLQLGWFTGKGLCRTGSGERLNVVRLSLSR